MTFINIIHAGGKIENYTYTNSYESIINSIINCQKNILYTINKIYIELDVIKIKDSFVIAHNGCEKMYGYDGDFNNINYDDYTKLKVFNKFQSMTFSKLNDIINLYKDVNFVLDIKPRGKEYEETLIHVKSILGDNIKNIVPQIYCIDDFNYSYILEYEKCLFATYNIVCETNLPISSQKIQCVIDHIEQQNGTLIGISVHIGSYNSSEFQTFSLLNKHKSIILHGHHECDEYKIINDLNNNGYGLFIYNT